MKRCFVVVVQNRPVNTLVSMQRLIEDYLLLVQIQAESLLKLIPTTHTHKKTDEHFGPKLKKKKKWQK